MQACSFRGQSASLVHPARHFRSGPHTSGGGHGDAAPHSRSAGSEQPNDESVPTQTDPDGHSPSESQLSRQEPKIQTSPSWQVRASSQAAPTLPSLPSVPPSPDVPPEPAGPAPLEPAIPPLPSRPPGPWGPTPLVDPALPGAPPEGDPAVRSPSPTMTWQAETRTTLNAADPALRESARRPCTAGVLDVHPMAARTKRQAPVRSTTRRRGRAEVVVRR
jgi:hypothetical protein